MLGNTPDGAKSSDFQRFHAVPKVTNDLPVGEYGCAAQKEGVTKMQRLNQGPENQQLEVRALKESGIPSQQH